LEKLLIATSNKHKIDEISKILTDVGISVLSINDFSNHPQVIEDRDTLAGNARKKAVEFAEYFDLPALADDTGLEVDALNGAPGVFSARYAGENAGYDENVNKLLQELKAVPPNLRTARFRTVMALAIGRQVFTVEGLCEGIITRNRRGDKGFGYDPVFFVPELNKTFAEMTLEEKNRTSHRGRALEKLRTLLIEKFGA